MTPAFGSLPVFVAGHLGAREALEKELPGCTLLVGPDGVGRRTLAEYLVRHHAVDPVDVRWVPKMAAADARELLAFSRRMPLASEVKVAVARLDGEGEKGERWTTSPAALNALLKLLEEPPASFRVVLLAAQRPLDTIVSRSHVWRLSPLGEDELYEALVELGEPPLRAREAARAVAPGTVRAALAAAEGGAAATRARGVVAPVLASVAALDAHALADAAGPLDEEAGRLLRTWLHEALTGRWKVFRAADCPGFDWKVPRDRAMLTAMLVSTGSAARPSLVVRTSWCDAVARRRALRDRGL